MRQIIGAVLLVLALLLIAGGGFEIAGMVGQPNLLTAIALSISAQFVMLIAGFAAVPRSGKVGFIRALAFTFYLVQTVSFVVILAEFFYGRLNHTQSSDSNETIWIFVQGFVAITLLSITSRLWGVFPKKRPKPL
jgi:hypothetical protein